VYNTIDTKKPHYLNGTFPVGTGPEVVFILGSCRVLPYFNYFHYLNTDNRFTIHLCNVVNFYFDENDKQVDGREFTKRFEDNAVLRDVLKSTKWFLHEHTANFGLFNTDRQQDKTIYQFGMAPELDLSIPNFNDIFILFQELVNFDERLRELARIQIKMDGVLSKLFQDTVRGLGESRIQDFLRICRLTSLPEMADLFELTWRNDRYFWSGNHISNKFTTTVFRLLNEKYFHMDIPQSFWDRVNSEDAYATPCSPITKYDREAFNLTWPQADEELKIP
jgi:hypothetical protein